MSIASFEIDSPLGRWTAHQWQPAHLAVVVELLWHFEGQLTHLRERAFPSGKLELIVHFGETYSLVEGKGSERCSVACREGAVSISELRERTGLTKTRLARAFREQIGVPPKLYARILRFRRLLGLLNQGAGPLADLAFDAGYYDQPHMNAEFRELSGLTPREFLASSRYANSVSLVEGA